MVPLLHLYIFGCCHYILYWGYYTSGDNFLFSVAQVKHFQTVRERSDPEFVSVQAKSSYIEDLFFFFCQVIFLNFFTVYIVFEESFLGTYPDNTVKIILVKRVYDWIIRYNMLVEYLILGMI